MDIVDILLSWSYGPSFAVGATVFLTVVAAGLLVVERQGRRQRIRSVVGDQRAGRLVRRDDVPPTATRLRRDVLGVMRASAGRANLLREQQATAVRQRLV